MISEVLFKQNEYFNNLSQIEHLKSYFFLLVNGNLKCKKRMSSLIAFHNAEYFDLHDIEIQVP